MNEETTYYCSNCLSLAIVNDGSLDYCSECGCAIIKETNSIEEWEKLRKEKYPNDPSKRVLHPRSIFVKQKKNEYYNK